MSAGETVTLTLYGMYHDVLRNARGDVLWDSGWRKNTIVTSCRILLASFMRGTTPSPAVGIQGLQVGMGLPAWDNGPLPTPDPGRTTLVDPNPFLVDPTHIKIDFLDGNTITTTPTNRLQIVATLGPNMPTSGNIGTTITLHGRNFLLSKPRVFFGSVEAPVIATINSNTFKGFELTANVPSGVTAESKITVQTDGGTAISDSLFTVIGAPSFAAPGSQFTPTGALPGQQVTLNGSNFNGNNLSVVLIPVANATDQGIAPASVTPNPTGTQITITIPTPPTPAGYGLYHIRVSTAAGVAPSDDAFTLEANPPTFAAPGSQFSPPSATVGIPVTVTLVGNHFDALPLSVAFTPASGSPIPVGSTLVDASHITISTAGVTNPGSYKITVTTPGGSKTSDDAFNMRAKGKDGGKDGKDGAKDIVKEGAKEGVKEAAVEKVHVDVVTPVRPLEKVQIDAKIADALNPVLPHNAINVGNGSAPPAVGHAFISMAERPDVESHVLLQADGHSGD